MEEVYSDNQLQAINKITQKLKENKFLNGTDLDIHEKEACRILKGKDWIEITETEASEILFVRTSNLFDYLLSGGTFNERYKRKLNSSIPQQTITIGNIIAKNSSIAVGSNINQSLDTSLFSEAIEQIQGEETLSKEEKEEIIQLLKNIKDTKLSNSPIEGKLMFQVGKWTDRVISLGKAAASIFGEVKDSLPM